MKSTKKTPTSFTLCDTCDRMLPETSFAKIYKRKENICKPCSNSKGWVYLVHNPAWPRVYKIGMSTNIKNRLNTYVSEAPYGDTKSVYVMPTDFYVEVERRLLFHFDANRIISQRGSKREWLERIVDHQEIVDSMIYFHEEEKALYELNYTDSYD